MNLHFTSNVYSEKGDVCETNKNLQAFEKRVDLFLKNFKVTPLCHNVSRNSTVQSV